MKLRKRGREAQSTVCDVTGRHRERDSEAEVVSPGGVARRIRGNGGMALLIGGVAAVPAVLGGVVAIAMNGDGESARPATQVTRSYVPPTPVPPTPRVYPTYGEYVPPPRVVATFTTRAPAPSTTPTATATPTPRFSCPPDWWRNPWLRRWCRMHTNVP